MSFGALMGELDAGICLPEAPREVVHNQAFNIGRTDENYQISTVADIPGLSCPLFSESTSI